MHFPRHNKLSKGHSGRDHDPVKSNTPPSTRLLRSPDSTCVESDLNSSSSCSSTYKDHVMSANEPQKTPTEQVSPNAKVTPQAPLKCKLKALSKRKLFASPSTSQAEDEKKNTPKRKKTAGECISGNSVSKTSNRLSVPLSERQQMALLMQMTAEPTESPRSPVLNTRSPKESSLTRKLNKRNEKGETPLHSATIKGDNKLVKKLIRQGADINIPDFAGWTPLHEACNHGWYDISKCLLRTGATVNVKGLDDDTPLHDASINGHKKLVELLVRSGANPLQANKKGKTPIDVATTEEVKHILKKETISSSSEDSGTEDPRSPTSPESDCTHDESESGVHSTSKNHNVFFADSFQLIPEFEANTEEGKSSPIIESSGVAVSRASQAAVSSTMRKTSPPQNNCKGPEKPSSPRLTLRFQSIRTKDNKNNTTACTSTKCDPEIVSSTEPKYQSYFVTMEPKDDVYEFNDTPPPMPLSSVRFPVVSASSDDYQPCDSQTENSAPKGCDSSTAEVTEGVSEPNAKVSPSEDKMDVDPISSNTTSPTKDIAQSVEPNLLNGSEVERKPGRESSSPINQVAVSSSSNLPVARKDSPNPVLEEGVNMEEAASSTAEETMDAPDSISALPTSTVAIPGCGNGNSNSSSPKVPPLKIVIPQSSEQDSKDKKASSARQALPYVVNSTAGGETTESAALYSTSSSQTTDSVRLTFSKSSDVALGGSEATPERTQRVTRSSHRMQAALASHNPDINVESRQDCNEDVLHHNSIGVLPRKRKLRSRDANSNINNSESNQSSASSTSSHEEPSLNCYQMFLDIRKQIDKRRKNLFVVHPKPPQGYKDYLINRCSYVLEGNASSRLSVPVIPPPQSLNGALKDLFVEHEKERYNLRLQHLIEKEKLVLSVEQEILRVHGRAARALANQTVPLSLCTILKDEEIYNTIQTEQEEKDKNVRSRYNGRLFLSWIQDVNDKWEKIKRAMLLRHHNEAESLHAVQKMSWEWKMKDVGSCDVRTTPVIDDLNVPMVHVNDDFDLHPA